MTGASAQVAAHVADATFDQLPPDAVAAARRSLLDALGVMLAASGVGEGCRAVIEQVIDDGGTPASTVLGDGRKVPAAAAAWANGAMAHALDFEDAHDGALVHPNAQTVPAVLALAEARGSSGRDVLAAIAVGCDLVCRLGLALGEDPALDGWYPPVLLQGFGAAAGASRILGLDPAGTLDALSLTLAQVTGTSEMARSPRSVVRGVRDAFGAHAGVRAAQLAARGVAGFEHPFEGEAGLFALYSHGRWHRDALLGGLGERFEGSAVSFKPWPSCRGTHAAIDAALALRAGGLDHREIDEVAEIVVVGAPLNRMLCEPREQRVAPRTAIDAKFSLPFTVARAIVHGAVGLDAFVPEALEDPTVRRLAARVRGADAPAVRDGAHDVTRCELEVAFGDGSATVVAGRAPGGPDRPMTDAQLEEKFAANADHALQPLASGVVERVVAAVASLDECDDVGRDLMSPLARPEPV